MVNIFADYKIMLNRTASKIIFFLSFMRICSLKILFFGIHRFTISICDAVVTRHLNLMTVQRYDYHSIKALEHLRAKSAASNKTASKWCEILRLLGREEGKGSGKSYMW